MSWDIGRVGRINGLLLRILLPLLFAIIGPAVHAAGQTTTALKSPGRLTLADPIVLEATVYGSAPTGDVAFMYQGGEVARATLGAPAADGSAKAVANFPAGTVVPGSYPLVAAYQGDSKNSASNSLTVVVEVLPSGGATTSTTLSVSPNPVLDGGTVTFTAAISGGTSATGVVNLYHQGQVVGTANVVNGVASFPGILVPAGSWAASARYEGDVGNKPSVSNTVLLRVQTAANTLPPAVVSPRVSKSFEYDANGNLRSETVGAGLYGFAMRTEKGFDRQDQVKQLLNASGKATQLERDGQGEVTKVTDPKSLQTTYARSGLGDVKTLTSPDTGATGHTYDEAGNLKTRTDARGVVATSSYDGLNRQTQLDFVKTGMTSQTFKWGWDEKDTERPYGKGRLTSTIFPAGSKKLIHNQQGRLTGQKLTVNAQAGANTTAVTLTTNYGYSPAGKLQSITYPSGRQVLYTLSNGEVSAVEVRATASATSGVGLMNSISWEPFGAPKSWQWVLANGSKLHERVYDDSGRLIRYPLGDTVRDLAYDAAGRISNYAHMDASTAALRPEWDQAFQYDEQSRLTKATANATTLSWEYDDNGNRTKAITGANIQTLAIASNSNRIASATTPNLSFGYDSAGNTTSKGGSGVVWSSTYDASGRMATVTVGSLTSTLHYDEQGLRVRKYNGSGTASTVLYAYDQSGQLLGEYDSTGKALREYVWLGNIPVGVFTPDPANLTGAPLVYAVQADHLNTPRVVMDKQWSPRWRWVADAFGTAAAEENPASKGVFTFNLRFPGQIFDKETGLHYNWHRDYDPGLGRYVQSDPIGLGDGINTYAYVGGDSVSKVDPDGLKLICIFPFGCVYRPDDVPPLIPDLPGFDGAKNGSSDGIFRSRDRDGDCESLPTKKECQTALKILKEFKRLAQKYGININPRRLEELDSKLALGEISSDDLPATLTREFPGNLRGKSLNEIERICSKVR